MKLAAIAGDMDSGWGIVVGEAFLPHDALPLGPGTPNDLDSLLQDDPERRQWILARTNEWLAQADFDRLFADGKAIRLGAVALAPPLTRPRKNVLCVGWNYAEHVAEGRQTSGRKRQVPDRPVYFTKPATSIVGPDQPVSFDPSWVGQVDWEVELGVVIGRSGRNIRLEHALDFVAGYMIINDISARDLQLTRGGQWFKGKSLDTFCPIGPWIVTSDEIPDPQSLDLSLSLNGQLMQKANTSQMIFPVQQLIADVSLGMTLQAGDILATGTPSGVGFGRRPQMFLKDGDVMEARIERIGTLRNPVTVTNRGFEDPLAQRASA